MDTWENFNLRAKKPMIVIEKMGDDGKEERTRRAMLRLCEAVYLKMQAFPATDAMKAYVICDCHPNDRLGERRKAKLPKPVQLPPTKEVKK